MIRLGWISRLRQAHGRTRQEPAVNEWYGELSLLRIEDRVLLDAAGITVAPVQDALSQPEVGEVLASPASVTAAAQSPSELLFESGKLVLRDVDAELSNRYEFTSEGNQLVITDAAGHTIASDIPGATGSGSNEVRLPWASVKASWTVDLAGGDNSVVFDLSANASQFFNRVSNIQILDNTSAGEISRINLIGNETADARVMPPTSSTSNVQVQLQDPSGNLGLNFAPKVAVEIGHFDDVQVNLGRDLSNSKQEVAIVSAATVREQATNRAAMEILLGDDTGSRGTVRAYDNQSLVLQASSRPGVDAFVQLLQANNPHGNESFEIDTGPNADASDDRITIEGRSTFAGDVTLETEVLDVRAGLTASGDVSVFARGDILFGARGFLSGIDVDLSSTLGAIVSEPGSTVSLRSESSTILTLAGIGSADNPLRTAVGEMALQVKNQGSIHIDEADALTVLAATTRKGTIKIDTGGALNVGSVRVAVNDEQHLIALTARQGDVTILGPIQKTRGNQSTNLDVRIVAVNGAIVDDPALNSSAVLGFNVELLSANGIGQAANPMQISIENLRAEVSQNGGIYLRETSLLTIEAFVANGPIVLEGGKTMTIAGIRSLGDLDYHDVQISVVDGDLNINGPILVGAKPQTRADLFLTAKRGSIEWLGTGDPFVLAGDRATLVARDTIGTNATPLRTTLRKLTAETGGGVWINNRGSLVLGNRGGAVGISTQDDIAVTTTKDILVLAPVSVSSGSDVNLAAGRDFTAESSIFAPSGDVNIAAGGDLATTNEAIVTSLNGTITLDAGGDMTLGDAINAPLGGVLMTATRGMNLLKPAAVTAVAANLRAGENLAIESSITTQNEISVVSDHHIRVSGNAALTSENSDVTLTSFNDHLVVGADLIATNGEVRLNAKGSLRTTATSDIQAVAARFVSGGDVVIESTIRTQDVVDVTARRNLRTSAVEIVSSSGDIVFTANRSITVGSSLDAASGIVRLTSGDDLRTTRSATITAATVELSTPTNLLVESSINTLTGDIELLAGEDIDVTRSGGVTSVSGDIRLVADDHQDGRGSVNFDGLLRSEQGDLLIRQSGANGEFGGRLFGTQRFVKTGRGSLTFTMMSDVQFSGTTTVVDGTLGIDTTWGPAGQVELLGDAVLTGKGNVLAAVASTSPQAKIISDGDLRLGDGSADGLAWAGILQVRNGDRATIRDADLAELGRLTSLASGTVLVARNGVEVGTGDRLVGDGEILGDVVVAGAGSVDPSTSIGVSQPAGGDLQLDPGATLELQVNPVGRQDRVSVNGIVAIDQAVLSIDASLAGLRPNQVFVLIANDGFEPIQGRFVSATGEVLDEGTVLDFGEASLTVSYSGGPGGNDLVLVAPDQEIFFIPVDKGGGAVFFVPPAVDLTLIPRDDPETPPLVNDNQVSRTSSIDDALSVNVEAEINAEARLFFRVVDDALDQEGEQEYELDPDDIRNLPSVFERYPFVDGHYRVYWQEAGSQRERLILDIHVYEGRVVPPNFRKQSTNDDGRAATEVDSNAVDTNTPQETDRDTLPEGVQDDRQPTDQSSTNRPTESLRSLSKVSRRIRQLRAQMS